MKYHTKKYLNDMCAWLTNEFPMNNKMINLRFLNMHLWFLSMIVGIHFLQFYHRYVLTNLLYITMFPGHLYTNVSMLTYKDHLVVLLLNLYKISMNFLLLLKGLHYFFVL